MIDIPAKGCKLSDEAKEKIRQARLGSHASEATKKKMSASQSGERNHNYGKSIPDYQKDMIRSKKIGTHQNDETRLKRSVALKEYYIRNPDAAIKKGEQLSSFNRGKSIPEDVKVKMSIAKRGERHFNYGKHLPYNTRLKIRETHKGDKCYNWKGGITKLNRAIRQLMQCREWSASVFERDDYVCQDCKKRSGVLEAHHIVPFHQIVKDYNIQTVEDAIACEFLWDLSNGVTLCRRCHKKLHKSDPEKE